MGAESRAVHGPAILPLPRGGNAMRKTMPIADDRMFPSDPPGRPEAPRRPVPGISTRADVEAAARMVGSRRPSPADEPLDQAA